LDRAHFSPGEIDGTAGGNTSRALDAFRRERGSRSRGPVSEEDWSALESDKAPTLVDYTLTEKDVKGPYQRNIPEDMMERAKLDALSYTSPLEALGERFHASPKLLRALNAGRGFARAGEVVQVPNVHTEAPGKAAKVVVTEADQSVVALDGRGRVLARFPATMGSEHDPLPIGTWKINGVSKDPPFFYNPDLFWDAKGDQSKAKIAPGPNNPVGVVWIDLSKEHYGIHGTRAASGRRSHFSPASWSGWWSCTCFSSGRASSCAARSRLLPAPYPSPLSLRSLRPPPSSPGIRLPPPRLRSLRSLRRPLRPLRLK